MKQGRNPVIPIIAMRTAQASMPALVLHWLFHWPFAGPHAMGLFLTPLLCLYFVFVFIAPWAWGLPILTRLPTQEMVVALTFDDGPSPQTTPAVLDILKRHGMTATFFVLGEAVERHPELVRRMVDEGHAVGIHAYHHRPFVLLPAQAVRKEIDAAKSAIAEACPAAAPPGWLRPPYGFKTLALPFLSRRDGCRLVAWSLDARDYRERNTQAIAEAVQKRLRPGSIILLHDGPTNGATVAALPLILQGLKAADYRCVGLTHSA